ncbi:MAG TPA: alpha/beta hydrolase [Thermoplasmata archaeon]
MVEERWALNREVRIHFLDSDQEGTGSRTPIVFVPGVLGSAEDCLTEMQAFASRRCVAMSLRGRGLSDAPETGYRFEDHVADIEAVVTTANLSGFCLCGYSVGVAYAIGFASEFPELLRGLVLIDYPARYPAFSESWVERAKPMMDESKRHAAVGLQREAAERPLWGLLSKISCPALVLRGGREDSLLSPEDARKYETHLRTASIQVFHDAGHEIWKPDSSRYLQSLEKFVESVDSLYGRRE